MSRPDGKEVKTASCSTAVRGEMSGYKASPRIADEAGELGPMYEQVGRYYAFEERQDPVTSLNFFPGPCCCCDCSLTNYPRVGVSVCCVRDIEQHPQHAAILARTALHSPYCRSRTHVWQAFLSLAHVWHSWVLLIRPVVPAFQRKTDEKQQARATRRTHS